MFQMIQIADKDTYLYPVGVSHLIEIPTYIKYEGKYWKHFDQVSIINNPGALPEL